MYPYSFICYLGTLELQFSCKTKQQAMEKLEQLLQIDQIGRFGSEGLGRVQWARGYIRSTHELAPRKGKRVRIRKGLPNPLPETVKELLRYALLHDFVHTESHRSKIYQELTLENEALMELLRQHHVKTTDPLIQTFQEYDRQAARMTRRIRAPITGRYNWQAKIAEIDFVKLATEIKQVAENVWKLYDYIYQSQELKQLTESMEYGHSSLRTHFLLIANLIVQDFLAGQLEDLSHGRDSVKRDYGQSTVAT